MRFSDRSSSAIEGSIPPYSCLVVDYHMSGMNGLELVARLRDRNGALPAVLITSSNDKVRNQAAASGVTMVEKPMLAGPLLRAVRAAFDGETT